DVAVGRAPWAGRLPGPDENRMETGGPWLLTPGGVGRDEPAVGRWFGRQLVDRGQVRQRSAQVQRDLGGHESYINARIGEVANLLRHSGHRNPRRRLAALLVRLREQDRSTLEEDSRHDVKTVDIRSRGNAHLSGG